MPLLFNGLRLTGMIIWSGAFVTGKKKQMEKTAETRVFGTGDLQQKIIQTGYVLIVSLFNYN